VRASTEFGSIDARRFDARRFDARRFDIKCVERNER
jgi:hypothetical protein